MNIDTTSTAARRRAGAKHVLGECGALAAGEAVTLICDPTTRAVADILMDAAVALGAAPALVEIPPLAMHGEEPPEAAARAMAAGALVVGVTAKSLAHTAARRAASERGARYLSLPDFDLDLLADPALLADYEQGARRARRIAEMFTAGTRARVTTPAGTDVTLDLTGRVGNCCPGRVRSAGDLGSPPDIEANISPVEGASEGVAVIDGSIPYPSLGLLAEPVRLRITGGRVVDMDGPGDVTAELTRLFGVADPDKTRVLAECGVGLNPLAKLRGNMLMDEGAWGTMHFGFGSNATVGGTNDVPFHLDFVFRAPTLTIDGAVAVRGGTPVE